METRQLTRYGNAIAALYLHILLIIYMEK